MYAFKIATTSKGARVWWAHWQCPHGLPGAIDIRDATQEEAALMEKVVWNRDTAADLDKIKALIARNFTAE